MEEDKEKGDGELIRQNRDLEMLQHAVDKSTRERENIQQEMDMLLDRINKMSDMLDKSRVSFLSGVDFQTKLEDCSYFVVHFPPNIDFLSSHIAVALLHISHKHRRKQHRTLSKTSPHENR